MGKGRKSNAERARIAEEERKNKEFESVLRKKWEMGKVVNMISGGEKTDKEVELLHYEPKKRDLGNQQIEKKRKGNN